MLSKRSLYRLYLTIKARHKKYWIVWLSRHEWYKFCCSERKLRSFIEYLLEKECLKAKKIVKSTTNQYLCNVYTLSKEFIEFLSNVREFNLNSTYTQDLVLWYISSLVEKRWNRYKIKTNDDVFIINDKWKYRWRIYSCKLNRLISLTMLQIELWKNTLS